MKNRKCQERGERLTLVHALVAAALIAGTAGGLPAFADEEPEPDKAAHLEPIAGTDIKRVSISLKAAKRLDIRTTKIREDGGVKTAPYSSVLYNEFGKTFVYTNPKPLTYVRSPVTIQKIAGDKAVMTAGPAVGTVVVSRGVWELFGAEVGVGEPE